MVLGTVAAVPKPVKPTAVGRIPPALYDVSLRSVEMKADRVGFGPAS
jgi:hypothetical protein